MLQSGLVRLNSVTWNRSRRPNANVFQIKAAMLSYTSPARMKR